MPIQQLANYAQTTLAASCTNAATTITVTSAAGLPTLGNFMLRIDDASPATTFEYVECTAVAGAVLTVTRGAEGTTGIAHNAGAFVGNDLTAAMLQRSVSLGTLAFATVTADQGTFFGSTDITGVAATFTALAGRRYSIAVKIAYSSTVAADVVQTMINEGVTQIDIAYHSLATAGQSEYVYYVAVVTPTVGAHTYKVVAQRAAGTGLITMRAAAPSGPAYILVEDIGT